MVRVYHDSTDSLSRGTVAVGSNAQGLYLLAWDMLQHHLSTSATGRANSSWRRRATPGSACTGTLGRGHGRASYRLTRPLGRLMVGLMWPLGYALYRRDRRRGIA